MHGLAPPRFAAKPVSARSLLRTGRSARTGSGTDPGPRSMSARSAVSSATVPSSISDWITRSIVVRARRSLGVDGTVAFAGGELADHLESAARHGGLAEQNGGVGHCHVDPPCLQRHEHGRRVAEPDRCPVRPQRAFDESGARRAGMHAHAQLADVAADPPLRRTSPSCRSRSGNRERRSPLGARARG